MRAVGEPVGGNCLECLQKNRVLIFPAADEETAIGHKCSPNSKIQATHQILEAWLVPQKTPIQIHAQMCHRGEALLIGSLQPLQGMVFVTGMSVKAGDLSGLNVGQTRTLA